ncbi:hypothetical protein QYS49_35295 [Marivirga salinae]|uniref:Uncharacterized protein n=1 Tax=Marivirga salinarum TaxID=3059078 RepID=A0AA51RDD8_9BACT|nr:hypothetical protein [Marivirga sp. BDSF4-3]WMN11777.1 hypothetical protein QYS49_39590 [Marivirga sp. BDSF4-3]WMN13008.1 hypothetical protein QYS49_35295 [Marivirga sp. BDSF4-3]
MNKTILKNILALISLSGLGLVMSILGLKMLIDNQTRNLDDTHKLTGTIELTQIVTDNKKVGAVPFTYTDQDYFGIKLKEHDKLFGTFNPKQSYYELQKQLNQGKQITIFYYDSSDKSPTNNVYQIESNGQIIVNHSDYQKNHSIAAIAIICFGLLCLGMLIWILKTKNIKENWAQHSV